MSETQAAENGAQVQVATAADQAQTTAPAKSKSKGTGNLIFDVASEIEHLSKVKALNQAEKLAEDIEANYFRLGGLLKLISKEQWFEGFPTFEAFVLEKFGFAKRKADYLISIYTNLVDKQIPWEKVAHLGWTKLKDLAPVLTLDNLDEWVAKAEKCTVMELLAMLKAPATPGEAGSAKTTTDVVKLKFSVHADQNEQIQAALAKAKGEMQTDHDNVALAAICTGYLANSSGVQAPADPLALFTSMGYEQVLGVFEKAFPNINLEVEVVSPAA